MIRIKQNEMPAGLYAAMMQVQDYLSNSGLDTVLIDLINMRVSQINGCAYCLDMHSKEATLRGETLQRLLSISAWRETSYYSDKERAVLAFAERITNISKEKHVDDLHEELEKHFSKAEIANLTLAVMQINSWNRLSISFGTEPGSYKVGTHKISAN